MAMREPQLDERRRFIRHPSGIPVRCQKQGEVAGDHHALRDISQGGLRFAAHEPYQPGDIVIVEFPTLRGGGLTVSGEIMWNRAESASMPLLYTTGLRFLDPQAFLKARIIEQVCHIEAYREAQRREHGRELTSTEAAREWIAHCASRFPGAG